MSPMLPSGVNVRHTNTYAELYHQGWTDVNIQSPVSCVMCGFFWGIEPPRLYSLACIT